jgi:hypothetical protein
MPTTKHRGYIECDDNTIPLFLATGPECFNFPAMPKPTEVNKTQVPLPPKNYSGAADKDGRKYEIDISACLSVSLLHLSQRMQAATSTTHDCSLAIHIS